MHCYVMWAVHIYTILFDVVSLNEKCSCLKCVLPLLFKGHLAICLVAKYKYFEQAIQNIYTFYPVIYEFNIALFKSNWSVMFLYTWK